MSRFDLLEILDRGQTGCHRFAREKHYRQVLYKDPCAYCGRHQPRSAKAAKKLPLACKPTIDHIVAKSQCPIPLRGENNHTAACYECNHSKADTDMLSFLLKRKKTDVPTRSDVLTPR